MEQPLASSSGSLFPLGESAVSPPQPGNRSAAALEPSGPPLSFQDQQTLSQLKRGNWAAMEQLVQRYQDRLYVTLLRMVNQPEDAADLVQETFVRAMQNIGRFEGKSAIYTWLFRIGVNLALSHRRAKQYRNAVSLDGDREADEEGVNQQAAGLKRQLAQDTEPDPSLSVEQRMEYERLVAALATLEPEFRAVIVLRDVEECDYEQIAAILEVPLGTIKSRLFRARSALRERLRTSPGASNGRASH